MSQSLTDWLQQSRLKVVAVDADRGHLRVKDDAELCSDLTCSERTIVVADVDAKLESLNPGDIVRVESTRGRVKKIVVVRRVWDELTSPEW